MTHTKGFLTKDQFGLATFVGEAEAFTRQENSR
jgi:hypothetical protein